MKTKSTWLVWLTLEASLLTGCVGVQPVPPPSSEELEGRGIERREATFIVPEMTTRPDVKRHLESSPTRNPTSADQYVGEWWLWREDVPSGWDIRFRVTAARQAGSQDVLSVTVQGRRGTYAGEMTRDSRSGRFAGCIRPTEETPYDNKGPWKVKGSIAHGTDGKPVVLIKIEWGPGNWTAYHSATVSATP